MRHYCNQFRFIGILALMLLACAVVSACGQGIFKLEFDPAGEKSHFNGSGVERGYGKLDATPEALKKPHQTITKEAAYYLAELDGAQLIAAIEPDPLTLVVDTDMDNDLSDETPIKPLDPDNPSQGFGVVTIKSANSVQFTLAFRCEIPEDGTPPILIFKPDGVYTGQITLGDKTYTVALEDSTFNGRYNDLFDPEKPSDTFAIDYNGDGGYDSWDEIRSLSALEVFGKSFYNVSVAPDGSSITFNSATPKAGNVRATSQGAILRMHSTSGDYRVDLRGDSMPLPVGKYYVTSFQICSWDDQGRRFRMQCIDLPEKLSSFEVREGETTLLEVGPPMKAKPVPVRDGNKIKVNVEIWGSYGDRYFPYVRPDTDGLEGWDGMKIIDEQGNVLDSGNFEYG